MNVLTEQINPADGQVPPLIFTLNACGEEKMSIEITRSFLLWCTIINYGILMVWFLFFTFGREWIHRLHGRWFLLSREQFDAIHYGGMAIFKLGIILFNLVPLIVLWIVC